MAAGDIAIPAKQIAENTAIAMIEEYGLDDPEFLNIPQENLQPYIISAIDESKHLKRPAIEEEASRITEIANKWALKMMREQGLEDRAFITLDGIEEHVREAIERSIGETRQNAPTIIDQ